jgi:hypothetical protein
MTADSVFWSVVGAKRNPIPQTKRNVQGDDEAGFYKTGWIFFKG